MSEILSPVGNVECLTAAVRAGADAVYLGMNDFNARRGAENFNNEQLVVAVEYCHVRGVKCYLTLNTQLYGNELRSATEAAIFAARCGIDGIICADLGLAKCLKSALPDIPLHASTQLSVHSAKSLPLLKKLGFCRVVPAREMSRDELTELCKTAKELQMEVEVFVHGALCMCLSGQCLISAFLGGRSGNRGLCAGTCRLPFSVGKGSENALSLKDLSLLDYLGELSEMGVDSFKIEGRKKPPEYVAAVTAACRQMLDKGFVDELLRQRLRQVFSRNGFTDGYYLDKTGLDMFGARSDAEQQLSKDVKTSLHELYRHERAAVPVDVKVACRAGKPLLVEISDTENTAFAEGEVPQKALNRATDCDSLRSALSKLGETPFYMRDFAAEVDDGLFVAASQLNALRRAAAEKLTEQRAKAHLVAVGGFEVSVGESFGGEIKLLAQFRDISQLPQGYSGVSAIILPAEQLEKYSGTLPVIAQLPRTVNDKSLNEKCLALAEKHAVGIICENSAQLAAALKTKLPVVCGSSFNVFNAATKNVILNLGAAGAWLSNEIRKTDAIALGKGALLSVYGKTPLMLTKNCPVSSFRGCGDCNHKITDRKGIDFPVYCRGGYSQLYNSRPVWLADRLHELRGVEYGVLVFCDESQSEVARITSAYLQREAPQGEYTRGLYEKGVL